VPALPHAVQLAPHRTLLRLGRGSRLVGLDPTSALAVDELPPALAAMLDELDGVRDPISTVQLVDRAVARGADRAAAEALLAELLAAEAVVDASGPQRRARQRADSAVVVRGGGPLAVGVALGLARAGVGAVHVVASGVVRTADLGTGLVDADRGDDRDLAIAAAVRRLCPRVVTGPPPQRLVPELAVLADHAAPEPVQIAALHAARTAHLPVRLRDGVGVIGPLVLPGRTACLGCLELERGSRDASWPAVAAQLVGRSGSAEPACAAATAALATAQALAALDAAVGGGPAPPTLEATLELDVAAGTLLHRPWSPRPECGCGAAAAPERHGNGLRHGRAACAHAGDRETITE
jgi:bacteriocin biosynthesis cyclodehydratase domain-containing protein